MTRSTDTCGPYFCGNTSRLRDGLQIETDPVSAKLELLAAVPHWVWREMEATAFVSPSKVPALADAAELAAERTTSDIEFSALVAEPQRRQAASQPGLHSTSTWCRPPTGTAARSRRSTAEATAQNSGDRRDRPRQRLSRWKSSSPPRGTARSRTDATSAGRRRITVATAADVDRPLPIADTIGTTTPRRVTDLIAKIRPLIGDIPLGAHFHNTRGTGLASRVRRGELGHSPDSTPRSAAWAAARLRPVQAATSRRAAAKLGRSWPTTSCATRAASDRGCRSTST